MNFEIKLVRPVPWGADITKGLLSVFLIKVIHEHLSKSNLQLPKIISNNFLKESIYCILKVYLQLFHEYYLKNFT